MKTFAKYQNIIAAISLALVACFTLSSCEEEQTYAEQKKAERRAINTFLSKGCTALADDSKDTLLHVEPITVITEHQFAEQDSTTDISKNEYVLLSASGVYMQIVRRGTGKKLQQGESSRVICRFMEYNISGDSLQTFNNTAYYIAVPDEMTVSNSYGTITGSFITGMMIKNYGSKSVPEGWLIPLNFINLGRQSSPNEDIAKVRIIVPHSSGQTSAVKSVYPCFYEITYEKGR